MWCLHIVDRNVTLWEEDGTRGYILEPGRIENAVFWIRIDLNFTEQGPILPMNVNVIVNVKLCNLCFSLRLRITVRNTFTFHWKNRPQDNPVMKNKIHCPKITGFRIF